MTDSAPAPLRPVPDDWRRALAVVAHPDDLEYGCSAAVASWVADGRQVTYLLATRGEAGIDTLDPGRADPLREAEQRAAAAAVGVRAVEFLDHRDGAIEYGVSLRRDIAAAVRRHRPELVITLNHRDTWAAGAWNTPDHVAVGRAVLDAAADAGNRWIFPELAEQGLRPWNGVRWVAVANSPTPTHAVSTEAGFEQGVRSLLRHRTYLEALTGGPRDVRAPFPGREHRRPPRTVRRHSRRRLRTVQPMTGRPRAPYASRRRRDSRHPHGPVPVSRKDPS